MAGKVFLVGAGPGDPDLLTLKAARLLSLADVVLHDELVSPQVLALIPTRAVVRSVGKRAGGTSTPQAEINRLMVAYAILGLTVIRLKGGDPLIFGRAGEEMEHLSNAGIEFEIIPGITSALAAAAAAAIPLTHREHASSVTFFAAHPADPKPEADWPALLAARGTIVLYMPGRDQTVLAAKLRASRVPANTPCAVISRATTREQRIFRTTVAGLAATTAFSAPSLVIVGSVVQLSAHTAAPIALAAPAANCRASL